MNKVKKISYFDIFIVFCLVGIVPFLLYAIKYEMPILSETGGLWTHYDYFNLIKVRVIKTIAFLIFLHELVEFLTSLKSFYIVDSIKSNFNKIYLFISFIFVSLLISFFMSKFKGIVLFGAMQRFESIWTHISYIIIFIYFLKFFKKEESFKIFSYALLLSTFVVGLIGTLQYFNINLMEYDFIKKLTMPKEFTLTIKSGGSFTTMYNTNTSASYSLLMIFLLMTVIYINKNIYVKILSIINILLLSITLYNSYSEATYIALIVAIAFIALISIALLIVKKKYKIFAVVTTFSLMVIVGVTTFLLSNSNTKNKIKSLVNSAIGPVAKFTDWEQINNEFYFYNKDDLYIKIILNEDNFEIFEEEELLFKESSENFDEYILETNNFADLKIQNFIYDDNKHYINFNDYFYIRNDKNPAIVDKNDFNNEATRVDFIGFEGYGNLFTNRGYIWSRSLAMLLEKPMGRGSDVFYFEFPNNDIVGRAFYNQPENIEIDKPHNIYLNMAINNGILYLIGFIGIVTKVFLDKIKLLYKKYDIINTKALIFYLGGLVAYLVNGLSTDNIVVIIMLFWIYLAIDDKVFITKEDKNHEEK